MRHCPLFFDWPNVGNNFSVVTPAICDSVCCSYACATWVSWRTKPMVLRSACGSCSKTVVSCTVDWAFQYLISEYWVIRHHSSGKVMRQVFQSFQKVINIFSSIFNYNLKWTEQLSCYKVSFLKSSEMLQRYFDCCWLVRSVNCRNGVVSERSSSK